MACRTSAKDGRKGRLKHLEDVIGGTGRQALADTHRDDRVEPSIAQVAGLEERRGAQVILVAVDALAAGDLSRDLGGACPDTAGAAQDERAVLRQEPQA